jgi:hypothetical protein
MGKSCQFAAEIVTDWRYVQQRDQGRCATARAGQVDQR